MIVDERTPGPKAQLTSALTQIISTLEFQNNYSFKFVSSAQARPYGIAYARWERGGRLGPPPVGTPAEIRAALYSQAETSSELAAFIRVSSVASIELAEAAISGLQVGKIIVTFTALRGLVERVAHVSALADATAGLLQSPVSGPLTPLLELHDIINRALYGTLRNWQALGEADFRKASPKDLKYFHKEGTSDVEAANILKSIDRLDRKIAGTLTGIRNSM